MSETLEKPNKLGRPTDYTQAIGEKILELHSDGLTIREICDQNDWAPHRAATVLDWADRFPDFAASLARSRKFFADSLAAKTLEAMTEERDPSRARVLMQGRQWLAGKLDSARFGDKVQIDVDHKVSLLDAITQASERALPIRDQHTDADSDVIDTTYELVTTSTDETTVGEELPDFFD